jgi:flagellin-like hook-associated protein FlgL
MNEKVKDQIVFKLHSLNNLALTHAKDMLSQEFKEALAKEQNRLMKQINRGEK